MPPFHPDQIAAHGMAADELRVLLVRYRRAMRPQRRLVWRLTARYVAFGIVAGLLFFGVIFALLVLFAIAWKRGAWSAGLVGIPAMLIFVMTLRSPLVRVVWEYAEGLGASHKEARETLAATRSVIARARALLPTAETRRPMFDSLGEDSLGGGAP